MSKDAFIGILIIFLGLGFLTFLTFLSRSIIERIAKTRAKSTRQMLKDLKNGK